MGAPMQGGAKPMPPVGGAKAPAVKAKKSKGTIAYIVISIILILGLAGVGVWGYFHYTDKLDKAEKDRKEAEEQLIIEYEAEIDSVESENTTLAMEVSDLEAEVSSLESQIAELESSVSGYEEYGALISYADGAVAQGSSNFFASANLINLSNGSAAIKVYYFDENGTVTYNIADTSVATCEWGEGWENDTVATLYVDPVATGNTTITLTNDTSDERIVIYIFVE